MWRRHERRFWWSGVKTSWVWTWNVARVFVLFSCYFMWSRQPVWFLLLSDNNSGSRSVCPLPGYHGYSVATEQTERWRAIRAFYRRTGLIWKVRNWCEGVWTCCSSTVSLEETSFTNISGGKPRRWATKNLMHYLFVRNIKPVGLDTVVMTIRKRSRESYSNWREMFKVLYSVVRSSVRFKVPAHLNEQTGNNSLDDLLMFVSNS